MLDADVGLGKRLGQGVLPVLVIPEVDVAADLVLIVPRASLDVVLVATDLSAAVEALDGNDPPQWVVAAVATVLLDDHALRHVPVVQQQGVARVVLDDEADDHDDDACRTDDEDDVPWHQRNEFRAPVGPCEHREPLEEDEDETEEHHNDAQNRQATGELLLHQERIFAPRLLLGGLVGYETTLVDGRECCHYWVSLSRR